MAYHIELLPKADAEFSNAANWYETINSDVGDLFIKRITERLLLIQNHPDRYPKIKGNLRQTSIKTFPFCIVYTVLKKEKKRIIVSIFHHSRNPKSKFR